MNDYFFVDRNCDITLCVTVYDVENEKNAQELTQKMQETLQKRLDSNKDCCGGVSAEYTESKFDEGYDYADYEVSYEYSETCEGEKGSPYTRYYDPPEYDTILAEEDISIDLESKIKGALKEMGYRNVDIEVLEDRTESLEDLLEKHDRELYEDSYDR